jgi:hypothetical protein
MLGATLMLIAVTAMPLRTVGQEQEHEKGHSRYKLIDMGTFGGPASNAIPFLNNSGTMIGGSATAVPAPPTTNPFGNGGFDGSVPFVFHTFEWKDGVVTDLGALLAATTTSAIPPRSMQAGRSLAIQKTELSIRYWALRRFVQLFGRRPNLGPGNAGRKPQPSERNQ